MTDKPKMRIQSITMDGSRVTDIEVVPVDAITGTQRCEPPNLVVEGCTVHNTVTLDLALVRALVEALEGAVMAWDKFYPSLPISDEAEDAEFGPMNAARAALARAKDAGL